MRYTFDWISDGGFQIELKTKAIYTSSVSPKAMRCETLQKQVGILLSKSMKWMTFPIS